jgi:hypothetical protein
MKKTFKLLVTIVACSLAFFILVWRFAPAKILRQVSKNIGPLAGLICQYPVQIKGDAMMPLFRNGQRIPLSRCIENRNNIPLGTIILYQCPVGMRLSVIRERIVDSDGVCYRVSQQARRQEIDDVRSDRIFAIYNKQ